MGAVMNACGLGLGVGGGTFEGYMLVCRDVFISIILSQSMNHYLGSFI